MPQGVFRPTARHLPAWSLGLGVVLAASVVFPLTRPGWLLVLDWVSGPQAHLPAGVYGQSVLGNAVPLQLLGLVLGYLLGRPETQWLTVAAVFPLATWSAGRLVGGDRLAARLAAGTLYAVNPIVFQRLGAGQVYFLLGYALLPAFTRSLLDAEGARGWARYRPALWMAACVVMSVHYAWICGLIVLALVAWRHRRSTTVWSAALLGVVALLGAYALVPAIGHQTGVTVGARNLAAYSTRGSQRFGLFVNVAGLYGFWRPGPVLPKEVLPGWPLLLAAVLVVAAVGAQAAWRGGRRVAVGVLGLAGTAGFLLALGAQGPTGAIFRLLYYHVPGFAVMREPQKFAVLVALAYATSFGEGVGELIRRADATRWQVGLAAAMAVVLPVAYTPTLFGGLDGQLHTSTYPAGWGQANRVMGDGPGAVLFLPWEQYLAFPFTHRQVIANPAPDVFSRPVIAGDNVELPGMASNSTSARGTYLSNLLDRGPTLSHFGRLVAQLGVSYVALAHTLDWRSYSWLGHESDLREVYTSASITVWYNTAALPQGARLAATLTVPSVEAYIRLAEHEDLSGTAVFVRPGVADPSVIPTATPTPAGPGPSLPKPVTDVRRLSPASYRVGAGPAGWLLLPESADPWWQFRGRGAVALADGAAAIKAPAAGGTASYLGLQRSLAGSTMSLASLAALLGGLAWDRRKRPGPFLTFHQINSGSQHYRHDPMSPSR